MSNPQLKALLVGVCEYDGTEYCDLPFCNRDVQELSELLETRLGVSKEDIDQLTNDVDFSIFQDAINRLCQSDFAVKLLFFSGHGEFAGNHFLRLTNKGCITKEVISKVAETCSSLIVILDCCYSGSVIDEFTQESREASLSECGEGVLLIASSTERERSYIDPPAGLSAFTKALCISIVGQTAPYRQFISIHDVLNICQRLMNRSASCPDGKDKQHMYVKDDLSGPITFQNPNYKPRDACCLSMHPIETIRGITVQFEPIHATRKKRYRAIAIIGEKPFNTESRNIICAIIDYALNLELFATNYMRTIHKGKKVMRVTGYLYPSAEDCVNHNHRYTFDWIAHGEQVITAVSDNCLIHVLSYRGGELRIGCNQQYESMKAFIDKNLLDKDEILFESATLFNRIDSIWRSVTTPINRFLSCQTDRNELHDAIITKRTAINIVKDEADNFGYADSKEAENLINALIGLTGLLHDLLLFCLPENMNHRTDENVRECLMDLRSRYAHDYEKVWRRLKKYK